MIVISQLIPLSEVLVAFGLTLENVLLPFLFILVPFLSLTIPMAYMFAVFLSFSRLSSDGEYAAMLSVGYSLKKASVPVIVLGALLYGCGVYCSMYAEPWGRRETVQFRHRKTQTALDNMIKVKLKSGIFLDDFLGYVLYAEKIADGNTHLENVMLAPGSQKSLQEFVLTAPTASITGSVEEANLRMSFNNGIFNVYNQKTKEVSVVKFGKVDLDLLRIFQEQIFGPDMAKDDYRSYNPLELWKFVDEMEKEQKTGEGNATYLRARFLLHQRIGLPFAVITFALFAMVLGIHDERRGKSFGYAGTLLTIIVSYVIMMGFKWAAEQGTISAPLGVWIPNLFLFGFGAFLVYQRNRLPPSESALDPKLIPGLSRLFR